MGRRRRFSEPPKPFDEAFKGIDTLEQNVAARTLEAHFTGEQVVRWMFPDDVVNTLQAAFPVIRDQDRTSYIQETVMLPVIFPAVSCSFTIKAKSKEIAMLVPMPGRVALHGERGVEILEAVRDAYAIHVQYEKVRKVARWLNLYATVGAARHYCPWLAGVLPAGHPFHEAGGTIYREPTISMIGIMGTMRECGAIMASALLCRSADDMPDKNLVAVTFRGNREFPTGGPAGSGGSAEYTSNSFGLI